MDRAVAALGDGELVVYPTETVYGLGADALNAAAVERVFDAKGRDRADPVSMAVPSVAAAAGPTRLTDRDRAFMEAFLPGPFTVVVERGPDVPDVLTAGRDRVGVRVPDHPVAVELLERAGPLTATSANVSGRGSVRTVSALDPEIRAAASEVLDAGETPGGQGSTVVDVGEGTVHRHGPRADEVEAWLAEH
ncbi:L-threonylcarbamoyladenylate synthase [Halosegnis marinus]|uniref:L-threonylcarbamoyladenylate synthase n=1 Tax=Halosegnis marinus TaxID=3034023 RepID=A0ABD5ZMT9_9EURY|nr:L-threonylcarbamoyladenylate synthase [Halosegnis sp. DT85]